MDRQKLTLASCFHEAHVESLSESQIKNLILNELNVKRETHLTNNYVLCLLRLSMIGLKKSMEDFFKKYDLKNLQIKKRRRNGYLGIIK